MTHSVTKSFVSVVVGLAFDRKLIKDLNAPVYKEMAPVLAYHPLQKFDEADKFGKSKFLELFETEHNRKITWDNLLRQTSDWEGTLGANPIGRTTRPRYEQLAQPPAQRTRKCV